MTETYRVEAETLSDVIITDAKGRRMRIHNTRQLDHFIENVEECIVRGEDALWYEYEGPTSKQVALMVERDKCQLLLHHLRMAGEVAFPQYREYDAQF